MAFVSLNQIDKVYPPTGKQEAFHAVKGISLDILDGEFMVLVGPSGCGKTSTLRMIAGLESISAGECRIGDQRVNDLPPKARDIAMVFQNYALYPHMTVRQNLAFGLYVQKYPKGEIEKRIQEAATMLGIGELLSRKPKALSGGQRQRVALGRALVRQPQVFLFDEPLSNLDAKMRVQMRGEIARLHQDLGTTMIYVTHDQMEAMTLGDRICVMNQGRIQQVGTPMEIYNSPSNPFVAGFIGSPPMNLFEVNVKKEVAKITFSQVGGLQLGPFEEQQFPEIPNELTLGIRPEHFSPVTTEVDAEPGILRAQVLGVEPMGAETLVSLKSGQAQFTARLDPDLQVEAGQSLSLQVRPERMHLFSALNGERLN